MDIHLLKSIIPKESQEEVLENILKSTKTRNTFTHVVSLNPEILMAMEGDMAFRETVTKAQIRVIDGVGVVLASRILGIPYGNRFNGVDLMERLLQEACVRSLVVMLIGGKPKIAEQVIDCQIEPRYKANFIGFEGIADIKNPLDSEEDKIFSIVADRKPHLVFASFGSPEQELWFYKNRAHFKSSVCIGVGGAFDFLSGAVPRAPHWIRMVGFEWLYRLVRQPWRWKRQLNLLKFSVKVLKLKLIYIFGSA